MIEIKAAGKQVEISCHGKSLDVLTEAVLTFISISEDMVEITQMSKEATARMICQKAIDIMKHEEEVENESENN